MKELLKITLIEEGVCEIKTSIENEEMGLELGAALIAAMARNKAICAAILSAASTFIENPEEIVRMANRKTIQIKPNNGHAS